MGERKGDGMNVLTGSTRSRKMVSKLRARGWGRMFVLDKPTPYPGEPWGFDNGAYGHWRHGEVFDNHAYAQRLERAHGIGTPYMAVLPDIVGQGTISLGLSLDWLNKVPADWPWYLAVQDGMTFQSVISILDERIIGIFLGGTNSFKLQAQDWCDLAHRRGKRFHYARAGVPWKVEHALRCGADSLDSALPLWERNRWTEFEQICTGTHPQLLLYTEVS